MLWLLVLVPPIVGACSDELYPCLKSEIRQAVAKIAQAESVRLLPGLTLDRKPGVQAPPLVSAPRSTSFHDLYKSVEKLFSTHSLYWNIIPGVDLTVSADDKGDFQLGVARCNHRQERTFRFGMRRMKMMLLPIMYKLGVITTLLTLLTVFALKGLTIGVLLLIMSTAGLVAKFKWSPHGGYGYPANGKEVHLHVHGGGSGGHYGSSPVVYHGPGYEEWVRQDKTGDWGEQQQRPWERPAGVVQQPHRIVHRVPQESTPSPWATYIGDQAL